MINLKSLELIENKISNQLQYDVFIKFCIDNNLPFTITFSKPWYYDEFAN